MGTLNIMGKEGDVKLEWDPDNEQEVEVAERAFKENIKKDFKAFRMYGNGKKGESLTKFDKTAEKILFVPPIVGG